MPKTKWNGAEENTINNFFKIDNRKFRICYFKVQTDRSQPQYFISTEIDRNTPCRQLSSVTYMVHQQRHVEKI